MTTRRLAIAAVGLLTLAACSSDGNDTNSSSPAETGATAATESTIPEIEPGGEIPPERCAANEAAGTITFLTGFDFAAASSIVDVIVADAGGYYDELCLDVEIRSSFSSANYPLVAEGNAQFASGGSFSEVVNFANANDAELLAMSVEGRTAIDTLIVKAGQATELGDLAGTTIGVKGKLPTSVDVMLRSAGLVEGDDFQTVLLDGFDPLAHLAQPIDGLPGWKSNEVGAVQRAGIGVQLFDPLEFGVPGSFGVIFTSADFAADHPTATADFMRATMRGLADAITDPAAAAATAVEQLEANGNPNFLSAETETFRWETEAALILEGTPEGVGFGVPDPVALQAEVDAYAEVGLFGEDVVPTATDYLGTDIMASLYDPDGILIFPG